jgi:ABC-2 type transport system ATP-binding protein
MESALVLNGIVKQRGGFTLGPLDFILPKGYVTGFVGANGAGKTTTLGIMMGLIEPDSGSVQVPAMNRIGVVLDEPFVVKDWTIAQAVRAIRGFYPAWNDRLFTELLDRFGLTVKQKVGQLSRGQKSKLMVGMALAHEPEILLCDEPTSGLDPAARAEVVDLFREYMIEDGRTVLFSTHITTDLEHLADFIAVINAGQLVFWGTRDDLMGAYALVRGGLDELTAENAPLVRGLRKTSLGFSGLIALRDSARFDAGVQLEEPTLDELVAHLSGGHSISQERTRI